MLRNNCVLSILSSGTLEERGMILWQAADFSEGDEGEIELLEDSSVYEIPTWTKFLRKYKFSTKIPFFPTYVTSKAAKKTN